MSEERLRIVIIGGVAGGASAAARARRVNAKAEIVLLERGANVSFANCGMPYHVGGEIASRDDLLVATPKLFRERFGIDVRLNTEATAIDRETMSVVVQDVDGRQDRIAYDRLILSPGAEPFRPPFLKRPLENVSPLWSLVDMDQIVRQLEGKPEARTVVIGGGFVGLEVAEQFVHRGLACTLMERGNQVLKTLDHEMAQPIGEALSAGGVDLRLGVNVEDLKVEGDRAVGVQLADETLPADLVVLAIGVRPRTPLAEVAGLTIGQAGGVQVDSAMRTNDPNIFAVGDCVEYEHGVLKRPALVPLAGPANRAGRVAGTNAAGGSAVMPKVWGTSVVRVFDQTAASTGLTQRHCEIEGIAHRAVYIEATDHASYFPGAQRLTLKLVYSPEGKILGAQCVGRAGADKRIDVIATAMSLGATVQDLSGVDLAYAPPFGSAKDPVHMAAFVACNDLQESPAVIAPNADLSGLQVVDVRSSAERESLPVPQLDVPAKHLPIDSLTQRLGELDRSRPTVTICHSGKRAHVAASLLATSGFENVRNLTGGVSIRRRFFAG